LRLCSRGIPRNPRPSHIRYGSVVHSR
jgi:hypothetical protein